MSKLDTIADEMCENLFPYLSRLGHPTKEIAVNGLITTFECTEELATKIYERWTKQCDEWRAKNMSDPHPAHKQIMKTFNILRKTL
tara:strand:- start:4713 stop:4970 length:258 start_codon:yes stop_codon:yes gene_type:complete